MEHDEQTAERVAEFFLRLPYATRTNGNWQLLEDNSVFNIDEKLYVNGFVCHIDLDYRGMYVLEIVERGMPNHASYLAVEYGPGMEHRQMWCPGGQLPLGERTSREYFDAISWAVGWMRENWATLGAVGE